MIGLLTYTTDNVGDDIQSVAARQHLPSVDAIIDRERLRTYSGPPLSMLLNGWFCHDVANSWPPANQIRGLPISMHITEAAHRDIFSSDWLRNNPPIGARDVATLQRLRNAEIDSYFSGCLTLTFPRYTGSRTGIYAVDVPSRYQLPRWLRASATAIGHVIPQNVRREPPRRLRMAESLLAKYRKARFVVTTRFHCALPCVAMGTPVLLINGDDRASGYEQIVHLATPDDARRGRFTYDFSDPPPPMDVCAIRDRLVMAYQNFIADATASVSTRQ